MDPVGTPATATRPHHRTLLAIAIPALILVAVLAINVMRGGSAGAETVSFLPAGASCSNSAETDDDPAACAASGGTLAPGGGVAIVENDNAGETTGDDDLQMVFDLAGLDASRITGANLEIGASQSGDPGTIQVGGPSISDTNYGAVSTSGGTATSSALVNAVASNAGGSITVWLQVACQGASDDCGAAVDSVRLNVGLEDLTPSVALVVSGSSNRSNPSALAGAELEGNAYVFIAPDNAINQVRFFLDDPSRNNAVRIENVGPFDFGGTQNGAAGPWNTDAVSAGSHTIAAEVDFNNGTSTVIQATFTTGDVTPTPGNPALLVSGNSNRSNSVLLNGTTLNSTAYIHVWPNDGINQVRFFLDDPSRNTADRVENVAPFDFGGTQNGGAGPWNPGSVSSGTHTLAAEVDFSNGSTIVLNSTFTTGGGSSTPTATPSPTATPTPPPGAPQDVFVSTSSNRANPQVLNGQTFDENIYVFVLTGDGVSQARFWVDDRNRNGAADRVENIFPFDLAGGSQTQAGAFDAGDLSEGVHWITVELDTSSGTQVVEGSFDVPASSGGGGGGGGTTAPPGSIRINPGQSIQAFVNANPAGTNFLIGSGVHRQQTVTPKNNNGFYGEAGAVVSGARVLNNWVSAGGGDYYVGNQTQEITPYGGCAYLESGGRDDRCRFAEQVYLNGVSLKQVFSRSALNSTNFYFDYGANRIYIGQSPSGKFLEASVSSRAFTAGGSNVTVAGMVIEKYSNKAQEGIVHAGNGWTIRDNEIRLGHGSGIRVTSNVKVLDNHIHHNGQLGIGGVGTNVLIEGNVVGDNNTDGFLWQWEAGGIKLAVSRDIVIRDNYVHDNAGRGIWTDLDVVNALIEDNRVEWNAHEGIAHEVSYDAVIRNNLVKYNGIAEHVQLWGAQILSQNSRNVEIYGNEVWIHPSFGDGIGLVEQNRGSGSYGEHKTVNNYVHHNEIHHESTTGNSGMAGGCSGNNLFNFNTYYAPSQYFTQYRFEYCGPKRTWAQFKSFGQEANGSAVFN